MKRILRETKHMLRIVLGLTTVVLLFCQATQAQQVAGKIVSDDGSELPGVSVMIEGTATGTTTDATGQYSLNVNNPDAILVFSFIGYKTERVPLEGKTTLNVTLQPDVQTLSEVVVVGYGTQKKVNMTAAVSTVAGEEITTRQAPSTVALLQGRTPGLQITQNSAAPGDESNQIRIRGQGTFSSAGSNPLVLIDGVEGKLELLNPNVIEDISVL